MVVIGNKCDLEVERRVSFEEGLKYAQSEGDPFLKLLQKQELTLKILSKK
jgi:GTPase KRas